MKTLLPVTGKAICEIANLATEDINIALDAPHKAKHTALGGYKMSGMVVNPLDGT